MTAAHDDASEGEVGAFVDVSARLTGFGAQELSALGMGETYRAVVLAQVGSERCARLVDALSGPGSHAAAHLDGELLELARAITHLWFTGSWPGRPGDSGSFVVSSASYAAGLVWRTLGGHAPGTRPAAFGSWAGTAAGAESVR
ncbi:hypothetical protein [Streptomyces sp. SID1034]|uniref:hypothetical protein n=1 Tax=Streptomyces sp. SID1034 TaxID=2690248 RepID=UPI00136DF666|nr:hypothetical protein [Streptomyces sp. SID1034]MYV90354.1 hypothetical protein [Streptomyces sp. SID1034]